MDTQPITPATLARSVIAVPPLARRGNLSIHREENARLVGHLEAGGIRTLLYGGNAVLGHVSLREYPELLAMLRDIVGPDTLVIPSVGPGFGMMLDQAAILRDFDFSTAMILPSRDPSTAEGLGNALRLFVARFGRPAVLYLKNDGAIDVETIRGLSRDGLVAWIKYAIVRRDPSDDPFLRELIDAVGPELIVSGMGEQPAIVHLRDFGLTSFTSGCVCVAPRLSQDLLRAAQAGDFATAERIRQQFAPLEALRDSISPVRVLHIAVQLAGVAETGPLVPPLSDVEPKQREAIERAARTLRG